MQTKDRKTLYSILAHKDYFDSRLIEIITSCQSNEVLLRKEIDSLSTENKCLTKRVKELSSTNKELLNRIDKLSLSLSKKEDTITDLQKEMNDLINQLKDEVNKNREMNKHYEEELKQYKKDREELTKEINRIRKKNSTNSNFGSSHDILSHTKIKANANTRQKSERHVGGQKGHVLHKSNISPAPVRIIDKTVVNAPNGAEPVYKNGKVLYYVTQEVDFVLKTMITETRYHIDKTGEMLSDSTLKKYAINPVSYSTRFKSSVVYLNQKGTIPYLRLSEILSDISNQEVQIKPSTIVKWNKEFNRKSPAAKEDILEKILTNNITHVDETSSRLHGNNVWIHAITNGNGSYFIYTKKRKDEEGPIPKLRDYDGYLVHDHFKAYYTLTSCKHVECNAHIDRYLQAGIDFDHNDECKEMKELLHNALHKKHELINQGIDSMREEEIKSIEDKYQKILEEGLEKYYKQYPNGQGKYKPEYVSLFKRMLKYRNEHLQFIKDFRVPYTNNDAERQCRVVKAKKKISGQFVSEEGIDSYVSLLTILQTARITNKNPLTMIEEIFG